MAGEYYRAKQRTGGLSGSLSPIFELLKEKQRKEEQKEYFNSLYSAYKSAKNKQNTIANTQLEPSTFQEGQGNVLSTMMGPKNEFTPPDIESTQGITDEVLGDYIPRQERLNKSEDIGNDFTIDQIMNPSEHIDAGRINVLGNQLQSNANRLKPPKTTVSERDPLKRYVERDDLGNEKVIQEAGEKTKPFDIEGSVKNSATKTYWTYNKQNGQWEDTKIAYDPNEGKTTVKIDMPKPEKWKEFGKVISDAKAKYIFGIDSEGRYKDPKSESEINQDFDRAKNQFLSTLLPNAKIWFEDNIKGHEQISDQTYLQKVYDAVSKDEITIEEGQDLVDANAYRGDLYGEKNTIFTNPKVKK